MESAQRRKGIAWRAVLMALAGFAVGAGSLRWLPASGGTVRQGDEKTAAAGSGRVDGAPAGVPSRVRPVAGGEHESGSAAKEEAAPPPSGPVKPEEEAAFLAMVRKVQEPDDGAKEEDLPRDFVDPYGQVFNNPNLATYYPGVSRDQLQAVVDEVLSAAVQGQRKRLHPDKRASRPDEGVRAYDIPPDVEALAALQKLAREKFSAITTDEAVRERLVRDLRPLLERFTTQGMTYFVSGEGAVRYRTYDAISREPTGSGEVAPTGQRRQVWNGIGGIYVDQPR